MLLELAIHDFAIIEATRVEFQPGMNVLTGETGAGKSILIDALGAVLGERVGPDVVRSGARQARIEATFAVDDLAERTVVLDALREVGVEPEDGLVIFTREIGAGGRSSARLNGRAVTASALNQVGAQLVDIHGQSDHLSLLRPAEHLPLLDRFADLDEERRQLSRLVEAWRTTRAAIAEIVDNEQARAQRVDLLRFQVGEISSANLRSGEDDELATERSVLVNAERLVRDAAAAYAALAGDDDETARLPAVATVETASQLLTSIAEVDQSVGPLAERLSEVGILMADIASDVRVYRDEIEADPARLSVVEDRLEAVKALKRKYGSSLEEVIRFGEQAAAELDRYEGSEGSVESLRSQEAEQRHELARRAIKLSAARTKAGERFARAVEAAIAELGMGRSQFAVSLTRTPDPDGVEVTGADAETQRVAIDASGIDRVEFLLASNAGEALKPLARVASGGETARLMLALKSILSNADATPVLVFDEVDVGVGGRSGQAVGEKLWGLAHDHQVLVITYLPQIAVFGAAHYKIEKRDQDGRIVSDVAPIAGEDRVDELAAMLGGTPPSEAAIGTAREMLARIDDWKASEPNRG